MCLSFLKLFLVDLRVSLWAGNVSGRRIQKSSKLNIVAISGKLDNLAKQKFYKFEATFLIETTTLQNLLKHPSTTNPKQARPTPKKKNHRPFPRFDIEILKLSFVVADEIPHQVHRPSEASAGGQQKATTAVCRATF